ncbi:hypothetical protein FNV43_RR19686 [Rhamnella rubrinervis]|uniref:C2 and GRAM domain-containing protein n=1 Tax=Rhamnella rubrinervis TaxID=2594499 RepID=A0A8K0GTX5_9ROSA|nr:hypothetical protein FNV43_RR19686 [Rhamnella rubrinervis]
MRVYVYVLEGKNLHGKECYVKLQVGRQKSKTRIKKKTTDPVWNEEFVFTLRDMDEEVVLAVFLRDDDSGFFNSSADLMGRIQIPVSSVAAEDNHTMPPTWFPLQRPKACGKYTSIDCEGKHLVKRVRKLFHKNEEAARLTYEAPRSNPLEFSGVVSEYEDCPEENSSNCSFEEALEMMQSKDDEEEMPENLRGAFLLIKHTWKDLAELQGATDVQEGPWTFNTGDKPCLTRVVTYKNAATKLVKAVKATEEQTYVKANGREFAVLVTVITPEVPYGSTFKVELLYKISPGPELPSGEETSCLTLSWAINFHQNTMLKGMIEGGAAQGLKESFNQFSDLLAQNIKVLNPADLSNKEHILSTLQIEHHSDWEMAVEYFWNVTVLTTVFMVVYVLVHILLCEPRKHEGLEFNGLDLPDRGDHGVKANGDGWILTVALIEGTNLASLGTSGPSDPYVAFTCNGKTRTSSVQFQTCDPRWNEVLEFDAMEEPPSVLDVEVYDFDGPFELAASLGYVEINFLKHSSTELADMWIPLEGKLAQSSQSKLHLRIFWIITKEGIQLGVFDQDGKEVGKKLNLRSPHRNSTFQKLFGLPPEEFLISDFNCHLKRKMGLQGRLFLSARIVGFYSNLFGHKTKFFFLWEDIEDIQVLPPSLASMGSPLLVIILMKGRGLDARHGARSQDEEGRLKYYFSFGSFSVACRIIMALWRTRTLTPEQKAQIAEEQEDQEENFVMLDNSGPIQEVEDAKMTKLYSAEFPVTMSLLMKMFDGGKLEYTIMEKSGCLHYATTAWQPIKPDVLERRLSYKFSRHVSFIFGEVTCTQHKSPIANDGGWMLDEVMALHSVPFCDHFRVHFRYQFKPNLAHNTCKCNIFIRIIWLKITKFQQRLAHNIIDKFTRRMRDVFGLAEEEILLHADHDTTS